MAERDEDLGRRIAELPVPDHRPTFWERLERKMSEDDAGHLSTRGGAKARRGTVLGGVLTAAALVLAVLAFVVTRPGGGDAERQVITEPGTRPAGGGDEHSIVIDNGDDPVERSVTGTAVAVDRSVPGAETRQRYRFLRSIDGSYSFESVDTGDRIAYDATSDRTLWSSTHEGDTAASVETNVAPGPPDRHRFTVLGHALDIEDFVVGAALSDLDSITETEQHGRDAWTYEGPIAPNEAAGGQVDNIVATVDQQTGILLRLVEKAGSKVLRDLTVDTFEPATSEASVDTKPSSEARVETTDQNFTRIRADEIDDAGVAAVPLHPERTAGCDPMCPPEGWDLAGTWVNVKGGGLTGPEASNPPSERILSLLYTNGWRRVTVTTRALVASPERWDDPFRGEGQIFAQQSELQLQADGAFAGAEGFLVLDPVTVPHVWAVSCGEDCTAANDWSGYVLTAAGAASVEELERFANVARSA